MCCMLAFLFTAPAAFADDDATDCRLRLYATLPIDASAHDHSLVPIVLEGHEKEFVVDTGSPMSMIKAGVVDELGLSRHRVIGLDSYVGSGREIKERAVVPDCLLGRMRGRDLDVRILPDNELEPSAAGILGADILRNYDIEFDFAANRMNIYSPDHCRGKVIYWTHDPYAAIRFDILPGYHIVIPVELDGVQMRAMIDTGAPFAMMLTDTARSKFSWDTDPPELRREGGAHSDYVYPFKMLSLGPASIHAPTVHMRDRFLVNGADLLLGLAALRAFHIYISYEERTIFLTTASAH
jgi:predicted aspartyl protease